MAAPETKLHQDVDTIRDILFGSHLQEILGRIDALEKEVVRLEKENQQVRKALKAEESSRQEADLRGNKALDETQNDLLAQLQTLDKKSDSHKEVLQQAIQDSRTTIGEQIKKLQKDLNAEMESHQLQQDELVEMLAGALAAYQNHSKSK